MSDEPDLSNVSEELLSDEIVALREQIAASEDALAEIKVSVDAANSELAPLNEQEKILRAQLAQVYAEQKAKRAIVDAQNKAKLAKQNEKAALERKLHTFLSEQALRNEWDVMSEQLDYVTRFSAWREHAYSHQIDGAKRLATARRAICGDKRGLGKSLTALIFIEMVKAKRVIIFTPRDVSGNFYREVKRWTPDHEVINMVGMPKGVRDNIYPMLEQKEKFMVILNYESWRRDPEVIKHLIRLGLDTVVIDEAHNLKNFKGTSYLGMKEVVYAENKCPLCGSMGDKIEHDYHGTRCTVCMMEDTEGKGMFCSVINVLPMSGTTIVNRPHDIWPILNLIDRWNFGELSYFLEDYARKGFDGRWTFQYGGQERLMKRLGSKYVGRTPETAGVEFPPQTEIIHDLYLDPMEYPKQYKVLKQVYEYGAIKFDAETVMPAYVKIAEITRRRQAAVWPAGIIYKDEEGNFLQRLDAHESIKLDKAMELIEEIAEEDEEPVVVFSMFKESLIELERRLNAAGISCVRYDGSTKDYMREQVQLDFDIKTVPRKPDGSIDMQQKRWKVFLGQYKSAATGLNLTAARQMILIDRNWSPANEDQASGRIQRLDSTQASIVHILHLNRLPFEKLGIDEFMSELMEIKAEAIQGFEDEAGKQEQLFRKLMGDA